MREVNWIKRILAKRELKKIKLTKESPWVVIYQSSEEISLRIHQTVLEDNEIKTFVFNQQDSSYNAFGYHYLQVLREDVERARELLNLPNE